MLKTYSALAPYLKRHRLSYLFGLISLIITSGGQLFIPQYIKRMVDTIAQGSFSPADLMRPLVFMVLLALVIGIGRFGWRFWLHGAARRIETELRADLFSHMTLLGDSYYQNHNTGDLMARGTHDLHQIRMATSMGLVAFFDGVFMTIAILVIMLEQNSELALFTIIPLPFITVLVLGLGKAIGSLFRAVQESFSRLSGQSQETFANLKLIQGFVKEQYFIKRFADANDQYQIQNLRLIQVWGFLFPLVTFLSGLTTLILLWVGGGKVISGSLSPGEFVATLNYLQMLIWPMLGAGFTVNLLQRGKTSLIRVQEIMNAAPEFTTDEGLLDECKPFSQSMVLSKVCAEYNETRVLSDISVSINAGETLGVLGPTGSGKTTLIRLLLRLVEPCDGEITIDSTPYGNVEPRSLRKRFGYVSQDSFLFSDSIRNNILFSLGEERGSVNEEHINKIITISGLQQDLDQFPEGIETQIGERGISVSGGQKQRIAIARGLMSNPDILILDDSLSAVDAQTEEHILSHIMAIRRGKTTIMISHRVNALRLSDTIIVLEQGTITHQGSHAELLRKDCYYRDIYNLQQSEDDTEAQL